MNLEAFYRFIQRMTAQHGNCRTTPQHKTKNGSVRMEFGSRFGLKPNPEEAGGLKGYWNRALKKECHGMKQILIEDDQVILDLAISKHISIENEKLVIQLARAKSTFTQPPSGHVVPLYSGFSLNEHGRLVIGLKDSREVSMKCKMLVIDLKSQRKSDPGIRDTDREGEGTYSKQDELCKLWFSGEYSSRDLCAETGCRIFNMPFSTALEVLESMPEPCR